MRSEAYVLALAPEYALTSRSGKTNWKPFKRQTQPSKRASKQRKKPHAPSSVGKPRIKNYNKPLSA
jgi:hypothetical protein